MNVNELKQKIYDLFLLIPGERDLGFLQVAFSGEAIGDIAVAVIELCIEDKLVIGTRGIGLPTTQVNSAEDGLDSKVVAPDSSVDSFESDDVDAQEGNGEQDNFITPQGMNDACASCDQVSAAESLDSTDSNDYLPEDEIEALIAGLKSSPNHPSFAVDAKESALDVVENPEGAALVDDHNGSEDDSTKNNFISDQAIHFNAPVFWSEPIDVLKLSVRPYNALKNAGIHTISNLIERFESLYSLDGMGEGSLKETQNALDAVAMPFRSDITKMQCLALRSATKSDAFLVDEFGIVRRAPQDIDALSGDIIQNGNTPDAGLRLSGIESLSLADKYMRKLRSAGIMTVGDIVSAGKRGLMDIRHAGMLFVEMVCSAVDSFYEEHGQAAPAWNAPLFPMISPADYLKQFDNATVMVLYSARALCEQRNYSVVSDAFDILMAPVAKRCLDSGMTPNTASDELVRNLESRPELRDSCRATLKERCDNALAEIGPCPDVHIPEGDLWCDLAKSLDDPRLSLDEGSRVIHVRHYLSHEWARLQEGFSFELLRMRFQGSTLQQVGEAHSITRERVRQLTEKALASRPVLAEDTWRQFFDTYEMSQEQFHAVTGLPVESFMYLQMTSKTRRSDRVRLSLALDDPNVNQTVKDNLSRPGVLDDLLVVNGQVIRLNKQSILEYLAFEHAADKTISIQDYMKLYEEFLAEYNLADDERFDTSGLRAFVAYIDRMDFVLNARVPGDEEGEKAGLRAYDASTKDFSKLKSFIESLANRNIEVSTAWIMRLPEAQSILRELDIRNEYELHLLLNKYCEDMSGIELDRVPMITLGNADRNEQILSVLKELGPSSAEDISKVYEERFGVRRATFRGSFLRSIEQYRTGDVYSYVDTSMDSTAAETLNRLLSGVANFCTIEEIERQLRSQCPSFGNGPITTAEVKPYGFEVSGALLVRMTCDLHAVFASLIERSGRFSLGLGEFTPEICSNEIFMSELKKAQRAFSVIEVNKDRFFSIREFESLSQPLTAEYFKAFLDQTIEEAKPDTPFNAYTLGMQDKLGCLRDVGETLGIGNYFIDSVLAQGYVGNQIKRTSMADTPLYCKTTGSFTSIEVLEEIIKPSGRMKVLDVQKVLAATYNVRLIPAQIRSIASRGGMRLSDLGNSIIVDSE